MNILIFSWKDIKHPDAGGAEIATHELAKRWVKMGHPVTLVTSFFPEANREELLDGVKIIRRGQTKSTVFFYAIWLYLTRLKKQSDIIIDQCHGIPFFTNYYTKTPKAAFIFEVAKNKWDLEFPFPVNTIGHLAEKLFLRSYHSVPFLTASHSTQNDLEKAGIKKIYTFPLGTNIIPPNEPINKEKIPTIISLGRLLPGKQIEHTIKAFSLLSNNTPAKLWIVGKGDSQYTKKLKSLTQKLNLTGKIKFWGYVSEKEKIELLQRAWLIVSTSAREGWGLNIIEAGVLGTPAVVYNSPGLRDAVRHRITGTICEESTPEELEKKLRELINNPELRVKLGKQAQELNQNLTWNKSAKIALDVLKSITAQWPHYQTPY